MDFKILMIAIFNLLHLDATFGAGVIDIHFLSYEDDCDDFAGQGDCDPMFTFCVTRPDAPNTFSRSECLYKTTQESGHFSNKNYINFENMDIIKGLTNPWNIRFGTLSDSSIKLVWRVREDEPLPIGSKHLVTASINLEERVWPNEEMAEYVKRKSQKSDHILRFKIRIYCTSDTYGPECAVYCPPPSISDKYTCDLETGEKKCFEGWEGEDCNTNVDECSKGVCAHGVCTDTPGSYTCENCKDGYSGQDCDIPDDACLQENPCQDRGDCSTSSIRPYFSCDCHYPYTGPQCDDESPTTTTTTTPSPITSTTITTTTESTDSSTQESSTTNSTTETSPMTMGVGNTGDATTTTTKDTGSTQGPRAEASQASSAAFDGWIIVVIGLCLLIVIVSVIICFVCRRKRTALRRKESRAALAAVTYDGENMAFDNVAYNQMNFNNSTLEIKGEVLPPLPTAPALTQLNPSFQPENNAKNGHEDMDDDGYLKANAISTFSRDCTDGLTASGRRALNNHYSNFENLKGDNNGTGNQDYDDEQHYHDLDEAAMSVRKKNNGDDSIRPLSVEEEGGYSEIPGNTPSSKNRKPAYDQVHIRPDSRSLPKIPNAPEDTSTSRESRKKDSAQPKNGKNFYPEMTNDPLRRSDPFASQVNDDEYIGPDVDLPTRDMGNEYATPRNSRKGGGFTSADEGGYEVTTSNGFDEGVSKRSNGSGGYEVPDRRPGEYDNITIREKGPPVPTKPNKLTTAGAAPIHQEQNTAHGEGHEEDDDDVSFPPPPPPLNPEDLDEIEDKPFPEGPASRPLSFHYGRSENEANDPENRKKKKNIGNDGFLNPLFGGRGPSDSNPPSSTDGNINMDSSEEPASGMKGSRPLSFHYGMTEKDDEDVDNTDSGDGLKLDTRKRLENSGHENPTFDTDGLRRTHDQSQRDADNMSDIEGSSDLQDEGKSPSEDDDVPIATAKPGVLPLYMENFGFY